MEVQLATERLLLRPFAPDDLDAVAAYLGDPETMAHMGGARPRDWAGAFLDWQRERCLENGYGIWAMVERATGRVIGDAGIQELGGPPAIAGHRLRYMLERRTWGQGLATEAARATVDFAFRLLRLDEVKAITHPAHRASQHVLSKIGMTSEGHVAYDGLDGTGGRVAVHRIDHAAYRSAAIS